MAKQLFSRPPSASCCLEEACDYWTMSASGAVLEGSETLVRGPHQASYRWHYRKNWRSTNPQPLDRYKWNTCAPHHLQQLHTGSQDQPQAPSQVKLGSLRRILPYLRSVSEPGASSNDHERRALRQAGSDAVERASSISSFISSLSRRISRVLRDSAEDAEDGEPGRTVQLRSVLFSFVCPLKIVL